MSQTVEQIWQQISTLPLPQQQELRDKLNSSLPQPKFISEDEFEEMLSAQGIIERNQPSRNNIVTMNNYQPIECKGKPTSELILEERR